MIVTATGTEVLAEDAAQTQSTATSPELDAPGIAETPQPQEAVMIPLAALTAHPGNVRKDLDVNAAFVASIKAEGIRPVRYRCVGCGHFSTDVSYLPDLETYLADLRCNHERLLAAVDVDDWARTEALPSDEEINRVRRLIERIKSDLGDLPAEERAEVEEAVATVRRNRGTIVNLGLPRVRQPLPDLRPERIA